MTGAFDGSYWRMNGGMIPSVFGTDDMAKATCCCTIDCAAVRSVPHFSQTKTMLRPLREMLST